MAVNRAGVAQEVVTPYALQQVFAREYQSRIAGQTPDNFDLLGRAGHDLAVQLYGERRHIDLQIFYAQFGILLFVALLVYAAQYGLYARHDLAGGEGLGYVVVCAQFQTQQLVDLFALCGQHYYGRGHVAANLAADGQTVGLGHHYVQHDHVGVQRLGFFDGFLAVVGGYYVIAFLAKIYVERLMNVGIIVGDKHTVARACIFHNV